MIRNRYADAPVAEVKPVNDPNPAFVRARVRGDAPWEEPLLGESANYPDHVAVFAPRGSVPRLHLGDPVLVRAQLCHESGLDPKGRTAVRWGERALQRAVGWRQREFVEPVRGVIVGSRTLVSGVLHQGGEEEPGYRATDFTHRAYVVSYHMRKLPFLVLTDDAELVPGRGVYCPGCGFDGVPPWAFYCPACGEEMPETEANRQL